MIKHWIIFILILACHGSQAQDQYVVDSILKEIPKLTNTEKEPYYSELAWQFMHSEIDKSHNYALEALKFAKASKDSVQLSDAYNTLGATYFRKGNYSEAIKANMEALLIRQAMNDIRGIGGSYSKLGLIYTDQGYFEKALDNQLKALDYFIQSEDIVAEAQTYNNICQIYNYLDNIDMAMLYANKCIKMYKTIDYPYGEATAIANLALGFENKKQYDSCLYYMTKAKDIFEAINDYVDVATSENAIGLYHRKTGNNKEGLEHYLKALEISKDLNDEPSIAQYQANVAAVYIDLGEKEKAKQLYLEALDYAIKNKVQRVERQCYDGLANYYEQTKNYAEAFKYKQLFIAINDSITNSEMQDAMIQADAKFQNTVNQQKILEQENELITKSQQEAELKKENAEKEASIKSQQLYWVIILSLLIIGIVVFYWMTKRKSLLKEKSFAETIAKEKDLGLQMTLNAQEQERQRIAKDLHDGVVQEIVAIKLDLNALPESDQKNKLLKNLDRTAQDVRNISHQMMPIALKELGLLPALRDLLEKILPASNIDFEYDEVGDFSQRLPEKIEISLYRITQELLNNVIKHSKADFVAVTVTNRNNFVTLIFEDNGKGFDQSKSSKGLGMTSLDSRVKMLNGKIEFENAENSGTMAIVRIPINK